MDMVHFTKASWPALALSGAHACFLQPVVSSGHLGVGALGVGALESGSCNSGAPSSAESSEHLSSKENLHLHLKHEFLMYVL